MKTTLASFMLLLMPLTGLAATTIDPVNDDAYGANIGWVNAYADGVNGAIINDSVCSGYIYSANVGWINLGNGSPTNGIGYQNVSANDFGVNNDGLGNLRGYAWGANIGWINFETNGAPYVDLQTGRFGGYIWSANCGWISLSNAVAYVQTDHILSGPPSTNGLPIAWLLTHFGTTNINPNADPAHDGMTVQQDYLAGTDPVNGTNYLHVATQSVLPGGTNITLTWPSVMTRNYYIQKTTNFSSAWADSGLGLIVPDGTSTTRSFVDPMAATHFYRIEAVRTLP